ncbi:MAG: pilus assembly protein [Pirellulaceae bacterium]
MLNPNSRRKKSRTGAVTVEFAICASVFFMTAFTLLEFSRFMFVRHSVEMVAYEAARQGVVPGATADNVNSRAQSLLNASGIKQATVAIQPPVINSLTEEVSVTVSCNFSENSWLPPTFLTGQTLVSTITLEHENKAYLAASGVDVMDVIGDNDDEPIDE